MSAPSSRPNIGNHTPLPPGGGFFITKPRRPRNQAPPPGGTGAQRRRGASLQHPPCKLWRKTSPSQGGAPVHTLGRRGPGRTKISRLSPGCILSTPNAPGQRAFSRCAASFFLAIRQDSCEKMSCAVRKFLAAGHIASFQIHPNPQIKASLRRKCSASLAPHHTAGYAEIRFPYTSGCAAITWIFPKSSGLRPHQRPPLIEGAVAASDWGRKPKEFRRSSASPEIRQIPPTKVRKNA